MPPSSPDMVLSPRALQSWHPSTPPPSDNAAWLAQREHLGRFPSAKLETFLRALSSHFNSLATQYQQQALRRVVQVLVHVAAPPAQPQVAICAGQLVRRDHSMAVVPRPGASELFGEWLYRYQLLAGGATDLLR